MTLKNAWKDKVYLGRLIFSETHPFPNKVYILTNAFSFKCHEWPEDDTKKTKKILKEKTWTMK